MSRAFVTGLKGSVLTADERAFLVEAMPWGLILFRRNVETPEQLRRLTDAFRDAVGWQAPVLVDQEGGRVQRLTAPIGASIRPAGDWPGRRRSWAISTSLPMSPISSGTI
jgi:Beta-glucosidase-related glycosidases